MKSCYCANCGKPLKVFNKAIPSKGIVINLVEYHECSAEPIPFDISNLPDIGTFTPEPGKDKFVKSLNDLKKRSMPEGGALRPSSMVGTDTLRDRRFDQEKQKSTAPQSVVDQIRSMQNSIPANEIKDDPSDSEMGG